MRSRTNGPTESRGLAALLSLPTEVAREFVQWPRTVIDEVPPPPPPKCPLSDVEARFLRTLIERPQTPSSALHKLLQISARRAIEIRESLIQRGYLRAHRVNTSARGRTAILLEPLAPAFEALGIPPSECSS